MNFNLDEVGPLMWLDIVGLCSKSKYRRHGRSWQYSSVLKKYLHVLSSKSHPYANF